MLKLLPPFDASSLLLHFSILCILQKNANLFCLQWLLLKCLDNHASFMVLLAQFCIFSESFLRQKQEMQGY